ncbi:MAG: zinc metalloprotease HtpX [Sulfurimonadaceae bacterium]|nr:zinc metalloprotease HtpX [Sulfurimonadaceae bacterium]
MENVKTFILLASLTVLLVMLGGYFGGTTGMAIALLLAGGMNFFAYYNSDKMILKHYNAIPVDRYSASGLYAIVEGLCEKSDLPLPAIYIINEQTPNAFATGRDPEHAAVAVTEGLLNILDENEIEAVLAHELSHIGHRDILIQTIAATIAGAIAMIANVMQFGAMFGNSRDRNPIIMILLAVLLPIAASIVQMTISRSREFKADAGAAQMTGRPEWLQSALMKLENYNRRGFVEGATPENAHMFIVSPFSGKKVSFSDLFRTHPSTEQRIERLERLKEEGHYKHNKLYERHYR